MPARPDSQEREFARWLATQAVDIFDEYGEMADELRDEWLAADDDDDRALLALGAFLASIEGLALKATSTIPLEALRRAGDLNGVDLPLFVSDPDTFEQRDLLIQQSRSLVDTVRRAARIQASSTGTSLSVVLGQQLTKAKLYGLRRAYDFTAVQAAQREIHSAGSGIFTSKIAVPVLDRDTTDLCRNRMAFQVRGWDEMFVDPKSGSQWMYPPFVGAELEASEDFHLCRTVSVPRR